jgi:hypothetical protein
VKAIIAGAKTNQIGDGKIIILPIDEGIRIRSEEHGEAAVDKYVVGFLQRQKAGCSQGTPFFLAAPLVKTPLCFVLGF